MTAINYNIIVLAALNEKLTSYFSDFFFKIIPKNPCVQWFDAAVEKMVALRLKTKVIGVFTISKSARSARYKMQFVGIITIQI